MAKQERRIIGWCAYCKSVLREGERYSTRENGVSLYHPECFIQKFSFNNSIGEQEENIPSHDTYPQFDDLEDDDTDN